MNEPNKYKWLFVVEGKNDVSTYKGLFGTFSKFEASDYHIVEGGGIIRVCDMTQWNNNLSGILHNDVGRAGFKGVILLVDSDTNDRTFIDIYKRSPNLTYEAQSQPQAVQKGYYWHLDTLVGTNLIPILGIAVPVGRAGCLETEMLTAYGFPIESQPEYDCLTEIIVKTSTAWKVPKKGDGKEWWEENKKAKIDKFIYHSFLEGFSSSKVSPPHPEEPDVIKYIDEAMNFSLPSQNNNFAGVAP